MPTPARRCCSGEQRAGCLRDATGLSGGNGRCWTWCNQMRQMRRTRGGRGGGGSGSALMLRLYRWLPAGSIARVRRGRRGLSLNLCACGGTAHGWPRFVSDVAVTSAFTGEGASCLHLGRAPCTPSTSSISTSMGACCVFRRGHCHDQPNDRRAKEGMEEAKPE